MNRWASYGIFCCVKHGKQVKLEKLGGSSFVYKDCHSESVFLFFFQPETSWLSFAIEFCIWVHFPTQCCFWDTKERLGGAGAMLVILSAFCSPWLVVGSLGERRSCWLFGDCFRKGPVHVSAASADLLIKGERKSSAKRRKQFKSFALPSLNGGPEHLLGGQVIHKEKQNTLQLCLEIE